jgi:Family of unknown function (DUF6166)
MSEREVTYRLFIGGHVLRDDGSSLPSRCDLRNHSPTGFSWGYGGSGPSQLALAILADFTGDDELALELYQAFKWDVIAKLDMHQSHTITATDIAAWLGTQRSSGND